MSEATRMDDWSDEVDEVVDPRRRTPRYSTYLDAALRFEPGQAAEEKGTILSMSLGGLFVTSNQPARPGQPVRIKFAAPEVGEVKVDGVVLYRTQVQGRDGLGLRFREPDGVRPAVESIRDWCREYGAA